MRPSPGWRPLSALALAVLGAHLLVLAVLAPHPQLAGAPTRLAMVWRVRPIDPPPPGLERHEAPALRRAAPSTPPEPAAPTHTAPPPATGQAGPATPARAAGELAPPTTPPAPLAGPLPPPMRLRYQVSGQARGLPVSGHAELAWWHDGQRYEATHEVAGPQLRRRSQHSAGTLTPQGLAPLRFAERARHEEAAHFDWAAGRIVFSNNQPEAALMPGAQDRLSLLLQIGVRLAADPAARRAGSRLQVTTTTTREAEPWHFVVEGEEQLQLPGGFHNTVRLLRLPGKEFDPRIDLWLAPALDYMPVRLRLTLPGGDWLEQHWAGTDRR